MLRLVDEKSKRVFWCTELGHAPHNPKFSAAAFAANAIECQLRACVSDIDSRPSRDPISRAFEEFAIEASILKVMGSELNFQLMDDGVQVHGGYGYIEEFPVERYMREAKVLQIVEGTNQIQRSVIARALLRG